MPCYHPIAAWKAPTGVKFHPIKDAAPIQLPCGRCIGCRLERSRQWAVRLMHESRSHQRSCFITLTYSKEHLPMNGSLVKEDFQLFMKKLRKKIFPRKVRFFHCGEYGDKLGRPHYHAILFGVDFLSTKYGSETSHDGFSLYCSSELDALWGNGIAKIGPVNFETCAYVARYCVKKVNGSMADEHYSKIHKETGEVIKIEPEYCTMSRRPGIGALHFDRYSNEIYLRDEITSRGGHKSKPPRFYDKLLARQNKDKYEDVKDLREHALSLTSLEDRSPRRLRDRETVQIAKSGLNKRKFENG